MHKLIRASLINFSLADQVAKKIYVHFMKTVLNGLKEKLRKSRLKYKVQRTKYKPREAERSRGWRQFV